MRFLSYLAALLFVVLLAACGGGGGSPGTVPGTVSGQTAVVNRPVLTLDLTNASGAQTTSLTATGSLILRMALTDRSGKPLPNQVIDVAADTTKVSFPDGNTALTNAAGIATLRLTGASLASAGAGLLTATYTYKAGTFLVFPDGSTPPAGDTVVTASIGYQVAAVNIALSNLDVGTTPIAAYGTRQISVQATVPGGVAGSQAVSFTASCGTVTPLSATTNTNGIATVSYTAADAVGRTTSTQGCGGRNVEITASIAGGAVLSRSLVVSAAPATNLTFLSVTPTKIFLANSGGPAQAVVQFKLVNAVGEGLPGQQVQISLKTVNGGIPKATLGTQGTTAPVVLTTDSSGIVSVPVFSGTVPTNVVVNATLVLNPLVQTDSSILTIASGRPAQARVSLAIEKFAIEGFNVDGQLSNVTLSLADRQGNPVPDGTAVNFVTEGGVMIPPVCTTGGVKDPITGLYSAAGNSQCAVQIRSQNPRPAGGRVSILAYTAGEEDFVDANFNNVYDCGESFTDLGTAFRDDNENGAFDSGEFSVPRGPSSSDCAAGVQPSPTSGDGVWGAADVRKQATIVFATSGAIINGSFQFPVTFTIPQGTSTTSVTEYVGLDVVVSDTNGNSMPTGTVISYAANDRTSDTNSCAIVGASSVTVPNTLSPIGVTVSFKGCRTGDLINVTVTSPGGTLTPKSFNVP